VNNCYREHSICQWSESGNMFAKRSALFLQESRSPLRYFPLHAAPAKERYYDNQLINNLGTDKGQSWD